MPIINLVYEGPKPQYSREPGANTLLYLPLESNITDQSGKTPTRAFGSSNISFGTVGGLNCISVQSNGGLKLTTPYPLQSDVTKPITISVLLYTSISQSSSRRSIVEFACTNYGRILLAYKDNTTNIRMSNSYETEVYASFANYVNTWMHLVVTGSVGNPYKIYINGSLASTGDTNLTRPWGNRPYSWDNYQGIFTDRNSYYGEGLNGAARELIMEEAERSAGDVSNYYNRIKNKLGF